MRARLELGILGPFEVSVEGQMVLGLGGTRQRSLLALLVLHADEVLSVDRLIDELWEDSPPATAVHTVQVFVSRLRASLASASDRLVTRGQAYKLEIEHDAIDAARCEHLYERGRAALAASAPDRAAGLLGDAVSLWRGPPLCDFTYERFAQAEIARLEEMRLGLREELIEAELALGEHRRLIGELEAFVREHPFRERPWAQLMLALYRCGRQADALDAFQQLSHKLREDLAVAPSQAVRDLEHQILTQDPALLSLPAPAATTSVGATQSLPPALRSMPTSPFVGREREERLAEMAMESVCAGSRQILVIEGEPGIGKTRLAARAALAAHGNGALVSCATAVEGLGAPYALWLATLSHLVEHGPPPALESVVARHGGELIRLVPDLRDHVAEVPAARRSDPETERYLMFQAVVNLLEQFSAAAPLAIVLDDLQWADAPSLALLNHVVANTGHVPLFLVVAYRKSDLSAEHALSDSLAVLHRFDDVERLELRGLTRDDVASLMAGLAGRDMDAEELALATEIAGDTDGNPFFVVQILRHLREHGVIAQDESGRWGVRQRASLPLPPSAREVVARRVRRLGDGVAALLDVAAVAGERFDVALLAVVAGEGEDAVLDALEAGVRASVLVEPADAPGTFAFAHALFRHSLYQGLSKARRAVVHRRVAEAIEALERDGGEARVAELARHWIATDSYPGKVVAYAQLAGELALTGLAPHDALNWFSEALNQLDRCPPDDTRRCDVLIGLGEARRQVGEPSFRECLLEASALAERLDDLERMTRAVVANTLGPFGAAGPPDDERIAALKRVLSKLPDDAPDAALVRAILAKEIYYGGDSHRGVQLGEAALDAAERRGDPRELARVLSFTAAISPIFPLKPHAERVGKLALLGDEFADPELQFRAANFRFIHAMHSGDRDSLEDALAVMLRLADTTGQPVLRWTSQWAQSAQLWIAGDLDASERATRAAAATAEAHAIPEGGLITFGQLLAVRGEQARLEEVRDRLTIQAQRNPGLLLLQLTRGLVEAETGHTEEAAAILAALAAADFPFEFDRTRAFNLARCADIALRIGAVDLASKLYERLLPCAEQFATAAGISCRGSSQLSLGRLATALKLFSAADEHLERALEAHVRFGAPLLEARTWLAIGASLLARSDPERAPDAESSLRRAAVLARRYGSVAVEREVESHRAQLRPAVPERMGG
jgi:DNA-binding SARP family transcriptional activator